MDLHWSLFLVKTPIYNTRTLQLLYTRLLSKIKLICGFLVENISMGVSQVYGSYAF